MVKSETFIVTRQELRKLLIAFQVREKNVENLLNDMEKAHRHIDVVKFSDMLTKAGLSRNNLGNILRRIGVDDLKIRNVLNSLDEVKIMRETGRLYNASIEYQ